MIPILTAAVGVVGGLLMGGCGTNELSKSLMDQNTQLEKQLTGTQLTLTGVAITTVILACGLATSVYHNTRRVTRGKDKSRSKTGK